MTLPDMSCVLHCQRGVTIGVFRMHKRSIAISDGGRFSSVLYLLIRELPRARRHRGTDLRSLSSKPANPNSHLCDSEGKIYVIQR